MVNTETSFLSDNLMQINGIPRNMTTIRTFSRKEIPRNFPKNFAKIRNKNNTKYRGISFREIFVATLVRTEIFFVCFEDTLGGGQWEGATASTQGGSSELVLSMSNKGEGAERADSFVAILYN